ncbi:uncharacterized protein LOC116186473 [Apis dorsata]|uniref:uncharacterized protein LOC116186473 n=1 Tax=Apis dorsata TaxID=7462 RepID=UPI001293848C|nr:uncharacterized protein LOC116186473 [Apis dorsata]
MFCKRIGAVGQRLLSPQRVRAQCCYYLVCFSQYLIGHHIKMKLPFKIIVDREHRDNASSRADNAMEIIDPGSPTGVCFERASSRTAVATTIEQASLSTTVATASSMIPNRIKWNKEHTYEITGCCRNTSHVSG